LVEQALLDVVGVIDV
jgi:hypothetical protein